MRKLLVAFLVVALMLVSVAPVFAHGGEEEGAVDAPTLVRQAIVFLEGIQDIGSAELKVTEALTAEGDSVNTAQLQQALEALKKSDIEEAKVLLVKSLGKDPLQAEELTLKPVSPSAGATTALTILAGALIILGGAIVLKVKGSH